MPVYDEEAAMWTWALMAYLIMLAAVVGCSAYVALFDTDIRRANRAYLIFKIAMGAFAGSAGILF